MDTALLATRRSTTRPNRTAKAILDELRRRPGLSAVNDADAGADPGTGSRPEPPVIGIDQTDLGGPDASPVIIDYARPHTTSGPVLVALDDDDNAAALTEYGLAESARRGVALRAVYVWTDCRPLECDHHLVCHRDLWDAERLLTALVDDHLSIDGATRIERDVLHDTDPVQALVELSASASMLIVGASSRWPGYGPLLGDTTRELVARAHCPLAVVPHRHLA